MTIRKAKRTAMTAKRWQLVQELFDDVISREPAEAITLLDKACVDDAELKAEVESLLSHHQTASPTFMRLPDRTTDSSFPDSSCDTDPLIGQAIGKYQIIEVIAVGGMGTVYLATQQQPKREVALKVLKAWAWSKQTKRRFEFESHTLARLTHPRIAQIYDMGTHEGLPFFVMELVPKALSITTYAERHKLSTEERLRLMLQVCDAVQYGHGKGIIHRDLKPPNILVDVNGHVKVIDFGVARATESDVAVTTMRTDVGQLIGTLQYMSPEQYDADPLGLDVRSDVYALGVVLYELLCECLPYDVAGTTITRAAQVICNEPPAKPSQINKLLRGDLERILLKALEKDRDRRYQSTADLLRDINHYLYREPIEARPPTLWVLGIKWMTRHPVATTAIAAIGTGTLILLATLVATWLVGFRPHKITINPDRSEARLVAANNNTLHEWSTIPGGIAFADLISRPKEFGGGRLAVLGFARDNPGSRRGSLLALDVGDTLETPAWQRRIKTEDLPKRLLDRGYGGADYCVLQCLVADIFSTVPGQEIATIHQHASYTQTALRIYDLQGKILYQIWIDFNFTNWRWLPDAGLLVMAGADGKVYWKDRGYPEVGASHPLVVFAVRPRLDFISKQYLREKPGDTALDPAWYLGLWPPELTDLCCEWELIPTYGRGEPGRSVGVNCCLGKGINAGVSWVIDEMGRLVDDTYRTNDVYERNLDKLPDKELFSLHTLPPIISKPETQHLANGSSGSN